MYGGGGEEKINETWRGYIISQAVWLPSSSVCVCWGGGGGGQGKGSTSTAHYRGTPGSGLRGRGLTL